MRKNVWLALLLVMILPAMLFTVSCAKKAVETQPAETPQPEQVTAPPKEDMAAAEAAEKARQEAARLRGETEAMARDVFINEDVYFEFDSSALLPDAQTVLGSKGSYLRANPDITVTIQGNCDERGTDAYNMALGQRRADSAKAFLVNMGIDADRLSTISYGEERPVDPGHNEAAWAKNRRDHFVIN